MRESGGQEMSAHDFQPVTIRSQIASLLQRLSKTVQSSRRELALDVVCEGIEALPIPVLNKVLARTIKKAFEQRHGGGNESAQEVMELLGRMQESDKALEDGLRGLGLDLQSIQRDISSIQIDARATRNILEQPDLRLRNV